MSSFYKTILPILITVGVGMPGCQSRSNDLKNGPQIGAISVAQSQRMLTFPQVSPIFREKPDCVDVYVPNQGVVYSYRPSELTDFGESSNEPELDISEQTRIINSAILGLFSSGIYQIEGPKFLSSSTIATELAKFKLAKPMLIRHLNEGAENYYLVAAVLDGKVVAGARVIYDLASPSGYRYTNFSFITQKNAYSSNTMTFSAYSKSDALRTANTVINKYNIQDTVITADRVDFLREHKGSFLNFMWQVKGRKRSIFISSSTSKAYEGIGGQTIQTVNGKLPKGLMVDLSSLD